MICHVQLFDNVGLWKYEGTSEELSQVRYRKNIWQWKNEEKERSSIETTLDQYWSMTSISADP